MGLVYTSGVREFEQQLRLRQGQQATLDARVFRGRQGNKKQKLAEDKERFGVETQRLKYQEDKINKQDGIENS